MKKFLVLSAALLISLGIATASMAATTNSAYVNIQITVSEAAGPSIVRTTSDLVSVPLEFGQQLVIPDGQKTTLRNNGNSVSNWSVWLDDAGIGSYTLKEDATALAVDEIRVSGIFHYDVAGTTAANFAANDILLNDNPPYGTLATATVFASDGGDAGVDGTAVGLNQTRDLRIMIDAPIAGSTPGALQVAPVVYASQP